MIVYQLGMEKTRLSASNFGFTWEREELTCTEVEGSD